MLKKLVKQASVTFKVRLNFLYFTLLKNIPPITYYLSNLIKIEFVC